MYTILRKRILAPLTLAFVTALMFTLSPPPAAATGCHITIDRLVHSIRHMQRADFSGCGLSGATPTIANRPDGSLPVELGQLPGGIYSEALAITPAGVILPILFW